MERVSFVAVFLLCFGELTTDATSGGTRPVRAFGQEYLSLRDWTERWLPDLKWSRKEDELRGTNKAWSLEFKLNSQRAEINGVNVFLSFPVIIQNGESFITSEDAD